MYHRTLDDVSLSQLKLLILCTDYPHLSSIEPQIIYLLTDLRIQHTEQRSVNVKTEKLLTFLYNY